MEKSLKGGNDRRTSSQRNQSDVCGGVCGHFAVARSDFA